jgi:mRNA-degrading endonuclease toxin of MazEF toxin-antitoxin module
MFGDIFICRVTGVLRGGALDVALKDWQTAGLLKPSVARLDRVVTAEKSILVRRLGALSVEDQNAIRDRWNQHMRLRTKNPRRVGRTRASYFAVCAGGRT